jgi:hypothetical protein
MALHILKSEQPYPTAGARIGSAIGSGLGSGLSSLVDNKLSELKQASEVKKLKERLIRSNIDPDDAETMAYIAVTNPQHYDKVWAQLNPRQYKEASEFGQENEGMEDQPRQEEQNEQYLQSPELMQQLNLQKLLSGIGQVTGQGNQNPLEGLGGQDLAQQNALNQLIKASGIQPNQEGLAQELSRPQPKPKPQPKPAPNRPVLQAEEPERAQLFGGGKGGKPLTETERLKQDVRNDELTIKRNDIENYLDIAKEMKADLQSGKVKLGFLPALQGSNEYTAGTLGDETGRFNKNAAELINYRTERLKGQQSKYRQQNIVKGKPGLGQTKNVNLGILNRYIEDGESMLKIFDEDHPDIAKKFKGRRSSSKMQYGPAYQAPDGQYFKWSEEDQDYLPARLKGK